MGEIVFRQESYQIMGACFEVYKAMGCGFLEAVYQECLQLKFASRQISFRPQQELELRYKDKVLTQKYVPDFVCFDKIIVEVKALKQLCNEHRAQVHNYLKATDYRLGLLVNFCHYLKVEYERIIR